MCKICARLYFFLQCTIYAQDLCKIVLISPMRNICARFAQDCTSFSNAQYMHKICARLYLFLQCAIYAQDLHKIVLISPMRNICARFAQDFTFFPNVQYLCKICTRLYFSPQCEIFAQDCRHYWEKYVTHHISALNLEWYSLHCYFWIATSSDFFLNKHLCRYQFDQLPSPGLTARPLIFSVNSPTPGTAFQCKNSGPQVKKTKQKSPPPGITCLVRMPRNQ